MKLVFIFYLEAEKDEKRDSLYQNPESQQISSPNM